MSGMKAPWWKSSSLGWFAVPDVDLQGEDGEEKLQEGRAQMYTRRWLGTTPNCSSDSLDSGGIGEVQDVHGGGGEEM